jgi:hypothetical protein
MGPHTGLTEVLGESIAQGLKRGFGAVFGATATACGRSPGRDENHPSAAQAGQILRLLRHG